MKEAEKQLLLLLFVKKLLKFVLFMKVCRKSRKWRIIFFLNIAALGAGAFGNSRSNCSSGCCGTLCCCFFSKRKNVYRYKRGVSIINFFFLFLFFRVERRTSVLRVLLASDDLICSSVNASQPH